MTADDPDPPTPTPAPVTGRRLRAGRLRSAPSLRWLVPLAGLLVVAGGLTSGVGPMQGWADGSDDRPPSCSEPDDVNYRDPRADGRVWRAAWSCTNARGAHVYAEPDPGRKIGVMDTAYSWFVCWASGTRQRNGSTVWYYTQGDRSLSGEEDLDAWGFMPSTDVPVSTHPWPGMPRCPS
jgi:hypothetical protein